MRYFLSDQASHFLIGVDIGAQLIKVDILVGLLLVSYLELVVEVACILISKEESLSVCGPAAVDRRQLPLPQLVLIVASMTI